MQRNNGMFHMRRVGRVVGKGRASVGGTGSRSGRRGSGML